MLTRSLRRICSVMILCAALGFVAALEAAPFVPARDAHCVAFSPDGRTVAIGYSGQSNSEFPPRPHPSPRKCGVVQLFDVASKKRLRRFETFGDLTQVAFSPDGSLVGASRIFATDDGVDLNEVRIWEVATGQVRFVFDRCHAFCFAPQRDEIVLASSKRCVVYSRTSGEKLRHIPPLANALCLAPVESGQAICGIVQTDGFALRVCDSGSGELRNESTSFPDPFYQLALPSHGRQLATGHLNGVVLLWDVASLQPTARISTGGTGRALPFFSRSGELLGAADQANSDVVIWDLQSGQELSRFTFRQGSRQTYRAKTAGRIARPEDDPQRFAFSPAGDAFLGGPYGGILRLVSDGRDIARFGE